LTRRISGYGGESVLCSTGTVWSATAAVSEMLVVVIQGDIPAATGSASAIGSVEVSLD